MFVPLMYETTHPLHVLQKVHPIIETIRYTVILFQKEKSDSTKKINLNVRNIQYNCKMLIIIHDANS